MIGARGQEQDPCCLQRKIFCFHLSKWGLQRLQDMLDIVLKFLLVLSSFLSPARFYYDVDSILAETNQECYTGDQLPLTEP